MTNRKKVVIIGAGFGGLELAKALINKPVDVMLIDKNNYHNFQPLMYQIATGGLEPYSIAYPVRRIFRRAKNVLCRMAEVTGIDQQENRIITNIGPFAYDFLVIATGSTTNYFNFEEIKDKLLTLKSIPDALALRSLVFRNLEKALFHRRKETTEEILNIAIVGGGPAGIELAGALAEMRKFVIPRDFPDLDVSKMNINLYESNSRLLKAMSPEASEKSFEYLQDLHINIHLNTRAQSYDGDLLILNNNTTFKTDTVIWTAGVKGNPIAGLSEDYLSGTRIRVDAYNKVVNTKNIFAVGDVAAHESEAYPKGLPMLAPVAQQQGELLAENILKWIKDKPAKAFEYKDKGTMATIGRRKAVVDLPNFKFQGTFAWIVWMIVHIASLVGFRNKFVAFFDWLSNYITYDKPLGLIIKPSSKTDKL